MITIIYPTNNTVTEPVKSLVIKHLIKAAEGKPIISVSQKPIDLGTNICLGEIGSSWMSLYKGLLAGLEATTTKYVAIAEHDVLYTAEHFNFIPPTDDTFYYNDNCWFVEWGGNHPELDGMYSHIKDRKALSQLICSRDLLKEFVNEVIGMLELGLNVSKGQNWHGEPGVHSDKYIKAALAATSGQPTQLQTYLKEYTEKYKSDSFKTVNPNLDIRHKGNFTGPRRGKRRTYNLAPWGEFKNII